MDEDKKTSHILLQLMAALVKKGVISLKDIREADIDIIVQEIAEEMQKDLSKALTELKKSAKKKKKP